MVSSGLVSFGVVWFGSLIGLVWFLDCVLRVGSSLKWALLWAGGRAAGQPGAALSQRGGGGHGRCPPQPFRMGFSSIRMGTCFFVASLWGKGALPKCLLKRQLRMFGMRS